MNADPHAELRALAQAAKEDCVFLGQLIPCRERPGADLCPACRTSQLGDAILALLDELREATSPERIATVMVATFRQQALERWPHLRGDGWPAYEEHNNDSQVLLVNEIADALSKALREKPRG